MVLKGDVNTTPEKLPIIIPELQNRSIISVVCGKSHFGALTSSGKLLTWGEYSEGSFGPWRPPQASCWVSGRVRRTERTIFS
jgi:SCF-associated factor 1